MLHWCLVLVILLCCYGISAAEYRCKTGHFKCASVETCIPHPWQCDGELDCKDGSDERNCASMPCDADSGHFRCDSGKCIRSNWHCDGERDCPDGSDEKSCNSRNITCSSDKFTCDDKFCIPKSWVCDHDKDCQDGSDEKQCKRTSCAGGTFTCKNGKCIPIRWKCDFDDDCGDGSDEDRAMCPPQSCKSNEFTCNNQRCIRRSWRCDGDNDCQDNSDEEASMCKGTIKIHCRSYEFACRSTNAGPIGRCILKKWVCDGKRDCSDGSDEEACHGIKLCRLNEFKCRNGSCIDISKKCNMVSDCPDGDDESSCSHSCKPGEFQCEHTKQCIPDSKVCDTKKDCEYGEDESMNCNINECLDQNAHCNQICFDKKVGYECRCKDGYQLESDGRTCEDVNECMVHGSCSQICENTKGSYKCSCMSAYILQSNGRSCKAIGQYPSLLFSDRHNIRNVLLNGDGMKQVADDLTSVIGIALDSAEERVYWADTRRNAINSVLLSQPKNKTRVKKLHDRSIPEAVAVDWIGRKLYWTDAGLDTIEVSELDGSYAYVLLQSRLDQPRAIAVDPTEEGRYIYWTDWGLFAKIERMSMDGDPSTRTILHNMTGSWPNGLSIDFTLFRIYWTDAKLKVIESSKLDGSDRRQILYIPDQHPFSIVTFEDFMYWSDWTNDAIYKANKFTGDGKSTLVSQAYSMMGVEIYHPLRQPNARNPCRRLNGGCSHLCLLSSKHDYTCRCPTGVKMLKDRQTCNTTRAYVCTPNYCLNGGECINSTSKKLKIVRTCRCLRGFQGRRCERKSLLPPGPTKPWSDTNTSGNSENGGVPHEDLGETIGIVSGVVLGILAVAFVIIYLFYRHLRKKLQGKKSC